MAILSTTTNYPLVTSGAGWSLSGPGGKTGLSSGSNGYWNYRSTTTGSTDTGPSIPPPGPDIYYWFTETSGTSIGNVFTMTLLDTLDAATYNYTIDFFYSNYGAGGGGQCLVQYWNGSSWVTVQTIGWDTVSSAWKTATQIDLSGYDNSDGQLRWYFTTGGSTTFQNDFALDDITITVETASSSSTSTSSSSTSYSSSSISSSSKSSSSVSTAIQDLTTFVEVDSGGYLTVTPTTVTFTNLQSQSLSYVYKDYGIDYFTNIQIEFDLAANPKIEGSSYVYPLILANTIGTWPDFSAAGEGIFVYLTSGASTGISAYLASRDGGWQAQSSAALGTIYSPFGPYYFTFTRALSSITLDIYTDSGRTILFDTLNISGHTPNAKRYLYVANSHQDTFDFEASGYNQNYEFTDISVSSSSQSSSSSSSSISSSSLSSSSASADIAFDGFFFNTSGNADWFVQSSTYHTVPDALQSGNINDSQETRIDLIIPEAGDISFYWKVSSESGWDKLKFYLNTFVDSISGEVNWQNFGPYHINPGDNVYWIYDKDGSVSNGSDTGWLDTFVFDADSSSSISASSSSVSSSSVSSSSSSSFSFSSSSASLAIGTWTWGQQTGVVSDYVVSFEDGEVMPWEGIIEGVGDNEHMLIYPGQTYALSEPAHVAAQSNIKLDYNKYAGSRDDSRFGDILYRTGTTRQSCLSAGWQPYNQSVDIVSLGWVQVSFTIDSSSSYSSSFSSSSSSTSFSLSSSSLSSSSYSSVCRGDLTFVDQDYQGQGVYYNVWGDGKFVYVTADNGGLKSYSVDFEGTFTYIDAAVPQIFFGDKIWDVWGDGNFIYTTSRTNGILYSYSVDEFGYLTVVDYDQQGGSYRDVWGDGNFIYVACGADGLRSYSVDEFGILTFIDVDVQGSGYYLGVWGDGNFIYTTCTSDGVRTYSVDGVGNLTYLSTTVSSGTWTGVWGDGTYIYCTLADNGIRSHSVDGAGTLTFIDHENFITGSHRKLWGDGTFVYVACTSAGVRCYHVDGGGFLTFIDNDTQNYQVYYHGLWVDDTYIYAGCTSDGIRSYITCGTVSSSSTSSSSSSLSSSSLSSSSSSLSSSSLSSSSSSLSSSSTSVAGDNFFDNTYWKPYSTFATWSVDKWIQGSSTGGHIWIETMTTGVNANWAVGYDPVFLRITLDNIFGGASTFNLYLYFTSSPRIESLNTPISNGVPYEFDVSAGTISPYRLGISNQGDTQYYELTDLYFHA